MCRDIFANPKDAIMVHHKEKNVITCIGWARFPIARIEVSVKIIEAAITVRVNNNAYMLQ
jgi:hypothetical protein